MNPRLLINSTLGIACLISTTACQTRTQDASIASRADLERQLADSRELVSRYEKRYGKLLPSRPAHDLRKLRVQLKGKPASAVVALLGKPAKVFTTGTSESWDYVNVAYDSASGRTVRTLEIWLRGGVVEYMNASY
ncbi:MAG: hypothetical protein ABMA13_15710 [Chthoniobacteraceae bacterium]